MILLGVDYGTKRVGLATMDTSVGFAFPLKTIEGGEDDVLAGEVVAAAKSEGADRIVVGMPVPLGEDEESVTAEKVQKFVTALSAEWPDVVIQNEQMTSAQVEKQWKDLGLKKGHVDVDAAAAALILETYFESGKVIR